MAETALADTGFLVGLVRSRDTHRAWSETTAGRFSPPWHTCEAVLTEAFFLLGPPGTSTLIDILRRAALRIAFDLDRELEPTFALMRKYSDVPMSLADACLVRMSELLPDPIVLTTDSDFRVYRRHGRKVIPCVTPD